MKSTKSVKASAKTAEKTVKETVMTAAAKAETVKEEVKEAAKTVETKAEETVKAAQAKAEKTVKAVGKTVTKKAPAKKAVKKAEVKETVYLQYLGKEIDKDELMAQVKKIWEEELNNKAADLKTITLYMKPEENAAYYVINGDVTGKIEM